MPTDTTMRAPAFYPWGPSPRCCDNHIDCDAAPKDAVHRFMDPEARRKNRETALNASAR